MSIDASCPNCHSRYQLHDDLRGRRMRCPNAGCRWIFTVGGTPTPSPEGPAEIVDWRDAPPPVQIANGAPARKERRKDKKNKYPIAEPAPGTATTGALKTEPHSPLVEPDPQPRRRGWLVGALVFGVLAVIGGGVWMIVYNFARSEDALRIVAEREYAGGSFRAAARKYEELLTRFNRSDRGSEYRFLADLSGVREAANRTPPEPIAALDAAGPFIQNYVRDARLKSRRDDLAASLLVIASELIAAGEAAVKEPATLATVPDLLKRGGEAIGFVERFPAPGADPAALTAKLDAISAAATAARDRQSHIAKIVAFLSSPKPQIDAARALIRRHRLDRDPAVAAALADAEKRLREVVYEPLNQQAQTAALPAGPPSILLEPYAGAGPPGSGDVVLAIARGLLYALDSRDGRRLWVARVGLDSGNLPVRVAPRGADPELVVVATSEPPSLVARELRTGTVRWRQMLNAPPLGRPVLASGRLFLATVGFAGQIYDFDARDGLCRGRFAAGQPLSAGAAFDPATGRLYVPTHGQYVYVFNYAAQTEVAGPAAAGSPRCEGLLETGHAPGALRGEPIVVSGDEGVEVPRYLVLGETDGLDAMKLRAFRLLERATAVGPMAEVRLPGWSWFAPYHDSEKLVLVTDAGALGLIGIQQKENADPPLFPLLGRDAPITEAARAPARAELVHAEEYGFWALAGNRLQHWRLGLDRRSGPKLTAAWSTSLAIGSPLHASQVSRDRNTLYLVTQTSSPAGHWATAVDARTGRIQWRRPLGLTVHGNPIELGGSVLTLEPNGAVYRFDPAAPREGEWTDGGRRVFDAVPELVGEPSLLRSADGRFAVVVAARTEGAAWQLIVRQIGADSVERTSTIELPSPPAGALALGPTALVLPLADGSLVRVPLAGDDKRDIGPNWRALGARPDSRGHVVPWRGDEFLATDGSRKLQRLRWTGGNQYELDTAKAIEFPARIVAGPIRVSGLTDSPPAAIVVDASGGVSLVRGDLPRIERTWTVGGMGEAVTAGPWSEGGRVFVVVANKRLVAIDPNRDALVWTYTTPGDGLAFSPAVIEGRLIVADLSGTFVTLDAATGQSTGPTFRHPADVAPASKPLAFGRGHAFAPLTDGSALILPLN